MKRPDHKAPVEVPAVLQVRLEQAGLRRTLATRAVLGLFLAQPEVALSHAQVQQALLARGLDINRVTLYRLLDRLAACRVLQRHADDGARTWRFSLADADAAGESPRFECDTCHRQFRLTEGLEPARQVTANLFRTLASLGHQGLRLDLSIHGTCAACVPDAPDAPDAWPVPSP